MLVLAASVALDPNTTIVIGSFQPNLANLIMKYFSITGALAAFFLALAAQASPITFVNTFPTTTQGGISTATFTIDSTKMPSIIGPSYFIYNNISVVIDGTTSIQQIGFEGYTNPDNTTFYALSIGTGLGFVNGIPLSVGEFAVEAFMTPSVLFTGQTSQPTFQLGVFTDLIFPETLAISSTAVPEPAGADLLVVGLLAAGCLFAWSGAIRPTRLVH